MHQFSFEAMGTVWAVLIDSDKVDPTLNDEIVRISNTFEQEFSRFIESSQTNQFRNSPAGTYTVSPQFAELLQFAQDLKQESSGLFDPAIGQLIEKAGYNKEYTFKPENNIEDWEVPVWSIDGDQLTLSRGMIFDVGGYGKGFWIDQLSEFLFEKKYPYHLVDGGGDMFGTSTREGAAWKIAIEWPGRPDYAIGQVELKNGALTVSDTFKRRWQNWHHVINPLTKQPVQTIIGCAVQAKTAVVADGLTTALMLSESSRWKTIAQRYHATYLMFTADSKIVMSPDWKGTFFN